MKTHFFSILVLISLFGYSQVETKQKTIGTILLDINFKEGVNLYEDCTASKILKSIKNNIKDEDYVYFDIIKSDKTMYYVIANYYINGFIAEGWIKKNNSAFGIYSKAYAGKLKLFEKPNKKSTAIVLNNYNTKLYKVFDCQNKWLLVEINYKKKKLKRWIEPAMQCDNPYTTCN